MTRGQATGRIELVRAAVSAPIAAMGLDLEAVELTPAGARSRLQIAVDKDNGVSLDEVAEATKQISAALDTAEAMGSQAYTLEVTSRGLDRPLVLPRHWRRSVGRLVEVTLYSGEVLTGRINGWEEEPDGGVTLDVDGDSRVVPYGTVRRALVQVEFNRPEEN